MYEPIQLTSTIPAERNSINHAPLRHGFVLIPFALAVAWFTLKPTAQAVLPPPPPDGGYPNQNTAEGDGALFSLTSPNNNGANNTAVGFNALFKNMGGCCQGGGSDNTAIGAEALDSNTTGSNSTATGFQALAANTTSGANTANGAFALRQNTLGHDNTASGFEALFSNTTGNANTANGSGALIVNTTGGANTANGSGALELNSTGSNNTATGFEALSGLRIPFTFNTGSNNTADGSQALLSNTTGTNNTATGIDALFSNTTGDHNTANGAFVLDRNTTGHHNSASGVSALGANTAGYSNSASGVFALNSNTSGHDNTANGNSALQNNTTGSFNTAVGSNAGANLTTGSNNIDIGALGVAGESNTLRIGTVKQTATFILGISGATVAGGVGVIIDTNGHLGTVASSERFKDAIKPMDKASEAILALKPVAFRYKHEFDPHGIPQFGLVAEQVEKVNPDLVARDEKGQVYTVRYEAVNAMLLNEFLKEHRRLEILQATVVRQQTEFAAQIVQQQKQIERLTAAVEKVGEQMELSKSAPQLVVNGQ
jgi:hypothetical protein